MSQAELPLNPFTNGFDRPLYESESPIVDVTVGVTVDVAAESEWETVSLPQTLDVDQLPEAESIDLTASLTQQNQTLRDRIEHLETSLAQSQIALRLELEHWESIVSSGDERIQEKDATIVRHLTEMAASQDKVTELFQTLETSHQTSQRQQILIETLNAQLLNSQERVAQLERECASTQQRFGEQTQTVMQQENQGRDLKARLYRQQRYTLQYKAALEKCLEVPTSAAPVAPVLISDSINSDHIKSGFGKQVSMPTSIPVQPWSAPETEVTDPSQTAWLNSFLSDSDQFPTTEAVTNLEWQSELAPQTLSFDMSEEFDASDNASIADRLDAWIEPDSDETTVSPSPFITLSPMSEVDLQEAGDVPLKKRESLAAVDLPTFPKATLIENAEVKRADVTVHA
jgi:hypothetical protein